MTQIPARCNTSGRIDCMPNKRNATGRKKKDTNTNEETLFHRRQPLFLNVFSAVASVVIDVQAIFILLKKSRKGRPGPTSYIISVCDARALILSTQRTG